MYEGIKAHGGPNNPKGMAHSLYFVGVTVLGNCILPGDLVCAFFGKCYKLVLRT